MPSARGKPILAPEKERASLYVAEPNSCSSNSEGVAMMGGNDHRLLTAAKDF